MMKTIRNSILLAALGLFGSTGLHAADAPATGAMPKDYPLKKCPVSGETYGEGGMVAYKVTHEGTDVWLCCKSCKKHFDKEPAKFTQVVKEAAAKK